MHILSLQVLTQTNTKIVFVSTISTSSILMLLSFPIFMSISSSIPIYSPCNPKYNDHVSQQDADMLQFAENLEYMEAEFFLLGALGVGLDVVAPQLVMGGPPPIGARKANLDLLTHNIIKEFGYQEVGHIRYVGDPRISWRGRLMLMLGPDSSHTWT